MSDKLTNKLTRAKAEELKKDAIVKTAVDLKAEFDNLFKDNLEEAEKALFAFIDAIGDDKLLQAILYNTGRFELYELLLDNTTEEIVEYFRNKVKEG